MRNLFQRKLSNLFDEFYKYICGFCPFDEQWIVFIHGTIVVIVPTPNNAKQNSSSVRFRLIINYTLTFLNLHTMTQLFPLILPTISLYVTISFPCILMGLALKTTRNILKRKLWKNYEKIILL